MPAIEFTIGKPSKIARSPKGGFQHPNGKFYAGGRFMPLLPPISGGSPEFVRVLATLSGSEKQVVWAEQIRAKVLAFLADQKAICVEEYVEDFGQTTGEAEAAFSKLEAEFTGRTSAKQWIDERFTWTTHGSAFSKRLAKIHAAK